ncbi:uracil-DNA glycosylase, partial [Corynebacterium sp.]|uniref:uracil-DNA glycosylase n=1 Tax=Corynebacterium sp. TaxID=1720 RepID=UPI0026499628
ASELPNDWRTAIGDEWFASYWEGRRKYLREGQRQHEIYPAADQVFAAFHLTPFASTRVVILGQDPYHQPGEAHGLAFSVPRGVRRPPSVAAIHRELESDLGVPPPRHGNLESWTRQGVLLLNTALTVRRGEPDARGKAGWRTFSDRVIEALSAKDALVVFVLWGGAARQRKTLIDDTRHKLIESAHPKARANAKEPFLGSRPFSRTNAHLKGAGQPVVDWSSIVQDEDIPDIHARMAARGS